MHSGERMTTLDKNALQMQSSDGTYDGKIAGLYDLEETLGSGHFAVVKLARHVFTGAKVAVKVVDKTKLDEVSKAHLFQEVRCMKLVQHPNVVRLYEVIDTQTKLYLVLELGDGGDLYDYIMKHEGGLSEELARKYFRQILRAITYCHQLHVVHRDLKPENVVFFEKLGVVKLTDFGFSNKFSPGQKLETFCGSLAYSAPEILLGDSYDAPAVDIWSLGVILYMLVCGQPPFEKANDSETLTMIMDCKYTVPPQISQTCRKLIASMLVRDPKKRATLEQIAADPWLKESGDIDVADFLPLVSRQELSEEDHAIIVQKMINGNIATKEEILLSLDKKNYNHITATYFLLAEIKLRKHREEENNKKKPQVLSSSNTKKAVCLKLIQNQLKTIESNKVVENIQFNDYLAAPCGSEAKTDKRSRKCSIVREEDEDESSFENAVGTNEVKLTIDRRESISDGRLNRAAKDKSNCSGPNQAVVAIDATLAHKLNQIDKYPVDILSNVSTKDELVIPADHHLNKPMKSLKGLKDIEIGNIKPSLTHRRTKLNKARTPSCSSSEASDDDTKARNKKKINKFVGDAPTRFRMHRRDSHDDSSDSQDQTFPSSMSHGHANLASNTVAGKRTEQTQNKEKKKSDDNRKSSHSHTHKNRKQQQPRDGNQKQCENEVYISANSVHRRRIRESQSLDRITEVQEHELRHRYLAVNSTFVLRNSLLNLNSYSVAETKEEYDEESEFNIKESKGFNKSQIMEDSNSLQSMCNKNIPKHANSFGEINLIIKDKSLTKAIQVTSSKYLVTLKRIRRLGKYFPVNFS